MGRNLDPGFTKSGTNKLMPTHMSSIHQMASKSKKQGPAKKPYISIMEATLEEDLAQSFRRRATS
jgi:hypothetical protein